jgi:putative tricarboxylic transport membrane protein
MTEGNQAGKRAWRQRLAARIHFQDLRNTGIILAGCGYLFYVTTGFEQVPDILAQNIPAQWFPRLLLWVIVALSLLLPFEHVFLRAGREELDEERRARIEPISLATALLLCLVVGAIHLLGTAAALILVTLALPLLWGERRWKVLVPYAILFPTAVVLLFTQVLKVYFEPGVLWNALW